MRVFNRLLQGKNSQRDVDVHIGELQLFHRAFAITALQASVRIGNSRRLGRIGGIVLVDCDRRINRQPCDRLFLICHFVEHSIRRASNLLALYIGHRRRPAHVLLADASLVVVS